LCVWYSEDETGLVIRRPPAHFLACCSSFNTPTPNPVKGNCPNIVLSAVYDANVGDRQIDEHRCHLKPTLHHQLQLESHMNFKLCGDMTLDCRRHSGHAVKISVGGTAWRAGYYGARPEPFPLLYLSYNIITTPVDGRDCIRTS